MRIQQHKLSLPPLPTTTVINWVQRMGQILRHGEKVLQIVWWGGGGGGQKQARVGNGKKKMPGARPAHQYSPRLPTFLSSAWLSHALQVQCRFVADILDHVGRHQSHLRTKPALHGNKVNMPQNCEPCTACPAYSVKLFGYPVYTPHRLNTSPSFFWHSHCDALRI